MTMTADATIEAPRIGRYQLDTRRSTVTFRTRHLFGLAHVRGSFAPRGGSLAVADPLGDSRALVEIDSASFHTGNGQRDANVRSARFLDADRHPAMRFTVERVERSAAGATLCGTLVVREVARPVELSVERCGPFAGPRPGFTVRATTRIDRFAFGLTAQRRMAGRHLDVTAEIVWVAA
jgi:polyisoprenoid-binding protein YceI